MLTILRNNYANGSARERLPGSFGYVERPLGTSYCVSHATRRTRNANSIFLKGGSLSSTQVWER